MNAAEHRHAVCLLRDERRSACSRPATWQAAGATADEERG